MTNENLEEFMKYIEIKTKEISEYRNNAKGIKYMFNTSQLFTRVDKLELTKQELQVAMFKGQVEKKDYQFYDTTRVKPKYETTKREEDKYTLIDAKIKATKIFNVSNQIGINKSFENQDEAFQFSDFINKEIMKKIGT